MKHTLRICLLGLVLACRSFASDAPCAPVSLDGTWRFQLDPDNKGVDDKWYERNLEDSITLPGTTDLAHKGYPLRKNSMDYEVKFPESDWPGHPTPARIDEAGHLVGDWAYIGKAWYQRDISIPDSWAEKQVELLLERVIWRTDVWVDHRLAGTCDSLAAEHRYLLGNLKPGMHRLSIRVDNGMQHNIGIVTHAYGPETQSRWNGIVGKLTLEPLEPVTLKKIRVFPKPERTGVRVEYTLLNVRENPWSGEIRFSIQDKDGKEMLTPLLVPVTAKPGEDVADIQLSLKEEARPWDEFNTDRYRLTAELIGEKLNHRKDTLFGFREIARQGKHIAVNGRRIFLRGTVDCCVYPRTGHPPVTVDEWLRVLGAMRDYGMNHVRFHTWCPPDAAFEAADRLGMYLAPETALWVDDWNLKLGTCPKAVGHDEEVAEFIQSEMKRISDAYGNHPSFAFFCIGNEFGYASTDWKKANQWIEELKRYDPRRLYTVCAARNNVKADDYWVTYEVNKNPTRGLSKRGTDWDFQGAADSTDTPVIAHETGQRPVFPDYAVLLPKFAGPLKPYNLERFQTQLAKAGLTDCIKDFVRSSARFQLAQYKQEHEGMLRTPDSAGYQLLMLNDFTGQSEALVGILDPYYESKGAVTPEEVRQWNSPTTPLARFAKFTWNNDEVFEAKAELAHYGPANQQGVEGRWMLALEGERKLSEGKFDPCTILTGNITPLGTIRADLHSVAKPSMMKLSLIVGSAANTWNLWVYPKLGEIVAPPEVKICATVDEAFQKLREGQRVILPMREVKTDYAKATSFLSVYWSAGWWGDAVSSLGVMCKPGHPALAGFPNDGYSDWQWWPLLENATAFILDGAPNGYRPIVQSVTDFHHNHLLATLFEARVGNGRLLVCGLNLNGSDPAQQWFRKSIYDYAGSDKFAPVQELSEDFLREILREGSKKSP